MPLNQTKLNISVVRYKSDIHKVKIYFLLSIFNKPLSSDRDWFIHFYLKIPKNVIRLFIGNDLWFVQNIVYHRYDMAMYETYIECP